MTPVLGGSFGTDNIVVLDFVVKLSLTGQDQVRGLPPGTKIAGIEVSNAGESYGHLRNVPAGNARHHN